MIPIPVFWTQYTATVQGRTLKFVPCENCSTEYVYLLEREGLGTGTSVYNVNRPGAEGHAVSAAQDTLKSVLENDFDPVPCPACGHYQRYMFPKLLEAKGTWPHTVMVGVILIDCVAAVVALRNTLGYLQDPNDHGLGTMVLAWSIVVLLGLVALGLSILNRSRTRRFDPNSEAHQVRIALGRSRAVTRAEFEKVQKEKGAAEADGGPGTGN